MSQKPDLPLNLYQVLEEEYESLHGPLPDTTEAHMPRPDGAAGPPVAVTSKRDWDFHAGHIKSPVAFARLLLGGEAARRSGLSVHAPYIYEQKVATLQERLRWNLRQSLAKEGAEKKALPDEAAANSVLESIRRREADEEILYRALNEALGDRELYGDESGGRPAAGKERFTYDWLSDVTRGLLSLRASGVEFGPEEIRQFNRHLLEDIFPDAFQKVSEVRLAAVYALFHRRQQAALSLSGGGIRSGTFALGVMQGLARHGLLEKFDYLSTVSGGGYTGSWLTAWIHRHPEGLAGVSRDMVEGGGERIDPDAAPLRYLRRYSNFITPKVGLLTADTWTFIGIYLRNTFLNWLVFVPLILSALMIPRLLLGLTMMQSRADDLHPLWGWGDTPAGGGLAPGFYPRHIFLTLGVLLGSWALAYVIVHKPNLRMVLEQRRPWFRGKTGQGGFLLLCLLPLLVSAFCLTTYYAWSREVREGAHASVLWFLGFGIVFILVAVFFASVIMKKPPMGRLMPVAEVLGLIAVGVLGGLLFWALAKNTLSPVAGYGGTSPFDWNNVHWLAWRTELYVCLAVPLFLLVFLTATVVFIGLTSTHRVSFIKDEDREWWARFGAWLLISIVVWVAGTGVVIFGPVGLLTLPKVLALVGTASGLFTLLTGRSSKTPASGDGQAQQGWLDKLSGSLLPVLALVFVLIAVAAFSLATTGLIWAAGYNAGTLADAAPVLGLDVERVTNARDFADYQRYINDGIRTDGLDNPAAARWQLTHMNVLHHTSIWLLLNLTAWLFGLGMVLARIINLNIFSLHGGYRNRLIRAFLGASRPERERRPDPFTGFDQADNLHMYELRPRLLSEGDFLKPEVIAAALKAALAQTGTQAPTKGSGSAPVPEPDAVSQFLVRDEKDNARRHERLRNARQMLQDFSPEAPAPQRLIADLRADLNTILKVDCLYKEDFAQPLLRSGRAKELADAVKRSQGLAESGDIAKLDRARLRDDYHILLNRLVLEAAYPGALRPSFYPPYNLMHVVNTTLNLVGGRNLAWQQRKAEPFSVSPLHAGCFRVGYRRSRDYGGRASNGISLGTAATASGAAASSNMGYYTTSPLISLLLTFFNVRLGLWLGNPGPHGKDTYHLSAPTLSFKPVLSEAFGLTDDTNPYVYLTDGGHFENLAFYEMVLRRCRFIVVSDAAADEQFRFGDLGNAVRKIRIDLGVPIDFWDVDIYPKAPPAEQGSGVYWALARIRYTQVDKGPDARDGVLLYIKPTVYGDEPRDVLEYKKSFPAFPHQSTADQFFDEPQFESYRTLGSHIMDRICGDGREPLGLSELVYCAIDGLKRAKPDKEVKAPFRLDRDFIAWMNRCIDDKVAVRPSHFPAEPVESQAERETGATGGGNGAQPKVEESGRV